MENQYLNDIVIKASMKRDCKGSFNLVKSALVHRAGLEEEIVMINDLLSHYIDIPELVDSEVLSRLNEANEANEVNEDLVKVILPRGHSFHVSEEKADEIETHLSRTQRNEKIKAITPPIVKKGASLECVGSKNVKGRKLKFTIGQIYIVQNVKSHHQKQISMKNDQGAIKWYSNSTIKIAFKEISTQHNSIAEVGDIFSCFKLLPKARAKFVLHAEYIVQKVKNDHRKNIAIRDEEAVLRWYSNKKFLNQFKKKIKEEHLESKQLVKKEDEVKLEISPAVGYEGSEQRDCIERYIRVRWGINPKCTRCGGDGILISVGHFKCFTEDLCGVYFNYTTNTIFEGSKVPFDKWFSFIDLIIQTKGQIRASEISDKLQVSVFIAEDMIKRVKNISPLSSFNNYLKATVKQIDHGK